MKAWTNNRVTWLLISVLTGLVLVGVGMVGVRLRSYWMAKYRGAQADLHRGVALDDVSRQGGPGEVIWTVSGG